MGSNFKALHEDCASIVCLADSAEDLLCIRAWLFDLHRELPELKAHVLGPSGTPAFFEMDTLPVASLVWPEAFKQANNWLGRRKLKTWLRESLKQWQAGVLFAAADSNFSSQLKDLMPEDCKLEVGAWREMGSELTAPTLQAGPSALAETTHYYRSLPSNAFKVLCVLEVDYLERPLLAPLRMLSARLEEALKPFEAQAAGLKMNLLITPLVLGELSKLDWREIKTVYPTARRTDFASLIGHVAYSDGVISNSACLPSLCAQMQRPAPHLL